MHPVHGHQLLGKIDMDTEFIFLCAVNVVAVLKHPIPHTSLSCHVMVPSEATWNHFCITFCINHPAWVSSCYYNNCSNSLVIFRTLSPSSESIPSHFLCGNRKMQPPPRVRLNLDMSLLPVARRWCESKSWPWVANLRLSIVNARSMRDKAPVLSDLMTSKNINILGITGTWLTLRENSADLDEMTPKGFSIFHKPRTQRRGGGVGLFISMAHKFTSISLPTQSSYESISDTLECGQSCLNVLNIYRPPGPSTSLCGELQDILSYMAWLSHDLVLMGDFNLHVESSSSDLRQLTGILQSFNLDQYVNFVTHIRGHSLDLMIFSKECNVLSVSTSNMILIIFLLLWIGIFQQIIVLLWRKLSHTGS